jgi:hypothetical protein
VRRRALLFKQEKDSLGVLVDIYEAAGSELFLTGFKNKNDADSKARESSVGFVKDVYVYEFQDGTYAVSSARGKDGKIVSAYSDGKRTDFSKKVAGFDYSQADKQKSGFVGTGTTSVGLGGSAYAPYGKTTVEQYEPLSVSQVKKVMVDLLKYALPIIKSKWDKILSIGKSQTIPHNKDSETVSYYVTVEPKKLTPRDPKGIVIEANNISRRGDWRKIRLVTDFEGKNPEWKVYDFT